MLIQSITSSSLTVSEKEIAVATLGKKLKDYTDDGLLVKLTGLILRTHSSCGQKVDEENIDLSINELITDLKKYNSTLSFQEIEIYFKNGWKGEYGEYFGLNNKTYFQWINAGAWNIKRANAKKAIEDAKKPKGKPEPSEEEKEKKVLGGVLRTFEDFKNGVVLFDPGNYAYNFLDKKGLIKFTTEEKRRIYNETKAKIRVNVVNNKQRTETIQQALDKALNEDLVKAESKREALRQYFKSLVEMEIKLSDELI